MVHSGHVKFFVVVDYMGVLYTRLCAELPRPRFPCLFKNPMTRTKCSEIRIIYGGRVPVDQITADAHSDFGNLWAGLYFWNLPHSSMCVYKIRPLAYNPRHASLRGQRDSPETSSVLREKNLINFTDSSHVRCSTAAESDLQTVISASESTVPAGRGNRDLISSWQLEVHSGSPYRSHWHRRAVTGPGLTSSPSRERSVTVGLSDLITDDARRGPRPVAAARSRSRLHGGLGLQ